MNTISSIILLSRQNCIAIFFKILLIIIPLTSKMVKFLHIIIFMVANFVTVYGICEYKHELSSKSVDTKFDDEPIHVIKITCSKIPPNFNLNLTNDHRLDRKNTTKITLEVVDSKISILPANTFLRNSIHNLEILELSGLGIEKLSPGAFIGLSELKSLNLSSNKLTKIAYGVFNNLTSLKILDLSRNVIHTIEGGSFFDCFVTTLLLNKNNFKIIYKNVTRELVLDNLDISGNPLEEFQKLGTRYVAHISLQNTSLKNFGVNLTNVKVYTFDISGSQLEAINFSQFPRLSYFDASSNNIRIVQNWNKLHGHIFRLTHNQIKEVDLSARCKILNLKHNKIASLKPTKHPNERLEILDLSSNEIADIPSETFSGLVTLSLLYLNNNRITVLHANTFGNCPILAFVHLENNTIKTIEANSFRNTPRIGIVHLDNNKLEELTPESLQGLPIEVYIGVKGNPVALKDLSETKKAYRHLDMN